MTAEEKKRLLDALDAAEREALDSSEPDVHGVLLKLVARVRAVVHEADTGDLPRSVAP